MQFKENSETLKQMVIDELNSGWSLRKLAKEIGVDATWLSRFYNDKYEKPSINNLDKLSKYFGL